MTTEEYPWNFGAGTSPHDHDERGRGIAWLDHLCRTSAKNGMAVTYRRLSAAGDDWPVGANERRWEVVVQGTRYVVAARAAPPQLELLETLMHGARYVTDDAEPGEDGGHYPRQTMVTLEDVFDAVWEFFPASDSVKFSSGWYQLLGYEVANDPTTPETFAQLVHPDDYGSVMDELNQFMRGNLKRFRRQFRLRAHDGSWRSVMTRVILADREADGTVSRVVGVHTDMTDVLRRDQELQDMRNLAMAVANSLPSTSFLIVATDGRIAAGYGGLLKTIGFSSSPEGTNLLNAVPQKAARKLRRLLTSEKPNPTATVSVKGRTLSMEVHRVSAADGRELGLPMDEARVLLVRDITENAKRFKEQEKVLKELEETNEELERFTYMISHDLKSPLVTVQGFLGFLKEDLEAGDHEQAAEDFQRIDGATRRMSQMLEELLELSRAGRIDNPPETVTLAGLIDDVRELLDGPITESGVELSVDLPGVRIRGDVPRLREVVQNVIENAIKFSRHRAPPRIAVSATVAVDEDEVCLAVEDNGIGIAEPYRERVFRVFEKLDRGVDGSGIGLSMVKRIVEHHGGTVSIHSARTGEGTRVEIVLPTYEERA